MPTWNHRFWTALSVLMLISFLFAAPIVLAGPAQCWLPADLAGTPSERFSRKRPAGAGVALPSPAIASPLPLNSVLPGSIRRVKLAGHQKLIALTFDVCEAGNEISGYDGEIVDLLRRQHVRETFFTGGKWLLTHKQRAAQLLADPLFEIGNHGWSHRNMPRLSPGAARAEVVQAEQAFATVRGQIGLMQCMRDKPGVADQPPRRMRLYRFPYGACDAASLRLVGDLGYLAVQWDIAMGDPSPSADTAEIVEKVLRLVRPGSIIVGHANGRGIHTAEALKVLIPKLRAKGYEFVTVSELLAHGTLEIAQQCYDRKPGDSDHYGQVAKSHAKVPVAGIPPPPG